MIMRLLSIALPASLLLLSANAGAQSGNYLSTDTPQVSTVQVTAPAPAYHLRYHQAERVKGSYDMSNGWRLKIEPARDGIVAQIDKQRPIKLIALSPEKFVTSDGNVAMEFNHGGDPDEMVMSYVPNSDLAQQVIVVTTTLAQR
jgi:nitrogen fixation protein